jgi:hypothetical protein
MKLLIFALLVSVSSAAFAKSTSCILLVDSTGTPVKSQYSCDGAELKDLYEASGISAALSKSIPFFLDQGYELVNCSDGSVDSANNLSYTYVRCYFIKK